MGKFKFFVFNILLVGFIEMVFCRCRGIEIFKFEIVLVVNIVFDLFCLICSVFLDVWDFLYGDVEFIDKLSNNVELFFVNFKGDLLVLFFDMFKNMCCFSCRF